MRCEDLPPAFWRFFVAETVSTFGDWLMPVATAFAALAVSGDAAAVAALVGAQTLARALGALAGGVAGDRMPRGAIAVGGHAARSAVQAAVALLLLSGEASLATLLLLGTAYGALQGATGPVTSSIVADLVPADRLEAANGVLSIGRHGAGILGPATAGALVAAADAGWAYAVDAATFALAGVVMWSVRVPPASVARVPSRPRADLAEGFRALRSQPWLARVLAYMFVWNLAFTPLFVLGPLVAEDHLGGAAAWAAAVTAAACGSVVGGLVAMRVRPRSPLAVVYGVGLLPAIELFAFAAHVPLAAIVATAVIAAGAMAISDTVLLSTLQRTTAPELLARIMSFDVLLSVAAQPVGIVLATALASGGHYGMSLGALGGLLVLVSLLGMALPETRLLSVPAMRATPAMPGETARRKSRQVTPDDRAMPALALGRPSAEDSPRAAPDVRSEV